MIKRHRSASEFVSTIWITSFPVYYTVYIYIYAMVCKSTNVTETLIVVPCARSLN